jgi:hypothetical protein
MLFNYFNISFYFKCSIFLIFLSSPLLLGGKNTSVLIAQCAVLTPLCIYASFKKHHFTVLCTVPLLISAFLHVIPFPIKWALLLQPNIARYTTGLNLSFLSTSLDIPATHHFILENIVLLLCTYAATYAFQTRKDLYDLSLWMLICGCIVVSIGFIHASLGWWRPYNTFGIQANPFSSTFINPNHLGAFCALCAFSGTGLCLDPHYSKRPLAIVCSIICITGTLCSLSRGAIITMGCVLVMLSLFIAWRTKNIFYAFSSFIALIVVVFILQNISLSSPETTQELSTIQTETFKSRFLLLKTLFPILKDFPFLGIGPGALGSTYAYYSHIPDNVTLAFAENQWLQILLDHGFVFGIFFYALFFVSIKTMFIKSLKDPWTLGVLLSWTYLLIHNCFDFNLAIPAVAFPSFTLMSLVTKKNSFLNLISPRCMPVFLLIPIALFSFYIQKNHHLEKETHHIAQCLNSKKTPPKDFTQLLENARKNHLSDYIIPLYASKCFFNHGMNKEGFSYLNMAMIFAPQSSQTHLQASYVFLKKGSYKQAYLELKTFFRKKPCSTQNVFHHILSYPKTKNMVFALLENFPEQTKNTIPALIQKNYTEEAWEIAQKKITEKNDLIPFLKDFFNFFNHQKNFQKSREAAEKIKALQNNTCEGDLLLVSLEEENKKLSLLKKLLTRCEEKKLIIDSIIHLYIKNNQAHEALIFIEEKITQKILQEDPQAYISLKSELCEKTNNIACAIENIRKLIQSDNTQAHYWIKLAKLHIQSGLTEEAYTQLQHAQHVVHDKNAILKEISSLQKEMLH